jgi:tRNA (adenine57-N1/adenine58-N1)-methyltransferase
MIRRGPFGEGDLVQLTDPKGRLHTIVLEHGGRFHTHRGAIAHDDVIGLDEGSVVSTDLSVCYLALRPLMSDFVLSMPRGAAIIYPKDASEILFRGDIRPGHTVVEAGVGSGALSLWLLQALGASGKLISIERREEFAEIARANVESFYHGAPDCPWDIQLGDLNDVLPEYPDGSVDRIVLDMLTPWECLDASLKALVSGGVIVVYVATVTQLSRVMEAMRESGRLTTPQATESMVRNWHVEGLAVRPDHRGVGHTGFLAWARKLAPGAVMPEREGRKVKPVYAAEDIEAWTPGAVGARVETEKKVRDLAKESAKRARKAADPKAK